MQSQSRKQLNECLKKRAIGLITKWQGCECAYEFVFWGGCLGDFAVVFL